MTVLAIRLYGDAVLRERAREVAQGDVDDQFRQWIADLGETMYLAAGVGLAANQVGSLRRVFVADVAQVDESGDGSRRRRRKDPSRRQLLAYINPEVLESSPEDDKYQEGCLSIPEVEADVYRPIRIRVRYRTLEWELREEWIDGLMARVFQHELDHLDGVLFVDHLAEDARRRVAGALNKIKRQHDDAVAAAATSGAGK